MKKLIIALLTIPLTFTISNLKAAPHYDTHHPLKSSVVSLDVPKTTAQEAVGSPQKSESTIITTPTPPPKQTAPMPKRWAVSVSPHAKVSVDEINTALAVYQDMGMSKQGAAYLVGNFVGESYLKACSQPGDGGRALGLAQWHPERRYDMPCDYVEQLKWAVDVEMPRDTPSLKTALFNPDIDVGTIQHELYKWERWGTLGGRWIYAADIHTQIN